MKQIIINVGKDATVTIEAQGFKGKGCADATKAIEEAMGVVTQSTKKPEFNQLVAGIQKVGLN